MMINVTGTLLLALALLITDVRAFTGRLSPRSAIRGTSLQMANLMDTAAKTGYFNTAVKAIKACGLETVLNGPGPYTLFLPSDEAFAKLPAGEVEALLKDIPRLTEILKFHVHPG